MVAVLMISSCGSNFSVVPIARETRHNFSARFKRSSAFSRSSADAQGCRIATGVGGQQKFLGRPAAFEAAKFRGSGEVDGIGRGIRFGEAGATGCPPCCYSICVLFTHDGHVSLGENLLDFVSPDRRSDVAQPPDLRRCGAGV